MTTLSPPSTLWPWQSCARVVGPQRRWSASWTTARACRRSHEELPVDQLVPRLGEVRLGPGGKLDLVTGERYEPDLFVLPAIDGRRPPAANASIRALLIVETLSAGSSRHDRITKRKSFQRNAVPEYWVVDGDAEAFEIWHPDDERAVLADDRVVWLPQGATKAFELDVRAFFASVADDARLG